MDRMLCSVIVLFLVLSSAGPAIAQDQQMVTSLFILVKTGDDDLRGGNDNAFVEVRAFNPDILRGDNANRSGVYVLTEAPLNNGARWKNNEFWDVEVRLPRAVTAGTPQKRGDQNQLQRRHRRGQLEHKPARSTGYRPQ